MPIQEVQFLKMKRNETYSGFRHLTVIYGDILDKAENVSHSVDKFLFPKQKVIEDDVLNMFFDNDEEFLFIDNIEKGIKNILSEIYVDIKQLKNQQDERAKYLAATNGISEELIKSAGIDLSDDDLKITEKLFKRQAEELSKKSYKINQLYDSLIDLNPTEKDYQTKLEDKGKELLKLIPQQNKQELSRYVIRREMVTKLLQLILADSLLYQNSSPKKGVRKDKEGLIHNLVFQRRKSTDTLNDLWILNEEFMHFEGWSDTPINEIKNSEGQFLIKDIKSEEELEKQFGINRSLQRPDIYLYQEEGKCILIEFKSHEIDLSSHLNQLTKYCNLIANCSNKKIDQFFCYLIGEKVDRVDLPGDYTKSIFGSYIKSNQAIKSFASGHEETTIANMYQEVIKLSSIHKRASLRNKSFADKLGLRLEEVPLSNEDFIVELPKK